MGAATNLNVLAVKQHRAQATTHKGPFFLAQGKERKAQGTPGTTRRRHCPNVVELPKPCPCTPGIKLG
jgi:hypothetical protein